MEIEDQALKLIVDSPEGVLQSELWKLLKIDSRKCSRIVKKLLDSEKIDRLEHKSDGIKTYRLRQKKKILNPDLIMAGGELLPCVGCEEECSFEECPYLMDWMYQLAIEDYQEKSE